MSFLNPVSEPVKRFSSTDASAPQINYNARVAGDVKTVLKACLVTGYGAKASAGWSVVNEVDYVAEFVSPNVAMSDYRLGIDDTSTSSTTWYYQYQDVRTNPNYNTPVKSFSYIDKINAKNGWELLVTTQGLFFVELTYNTVINKVLARITCFGRVKSALTSGAGKNISFWIAGHKAQVVTFSNTFKTADETYKHYRLENHSVVGIAATNIAAYLIDRKDYGLSVLESISPVYIEAKGAFIAQQPGLLLKDINIETSFIFDNDVVDGRPVLYIPCGIENGNVLTLREYGRVLAIYLDYWEY